MKVPNKSFFYPNGKKMSLPKTVKERATKYNWIMQLQVGDILRFKSGRLRVIRYTHQIASGALGAIHFDMTIQRCSWTKRCHTSFDGNALIRLKAVKVGHVKLNKTIDQKIAEELKWQFVSPNLRKIKLTCCDVEGVG